MIGTPSGVSLSPEGGLHQSMITPSIGMEMPELDYYEPTFGKELEWIFLSGMKNVISRTSSMYLRLTTSKLDQDLFTQYNSSKNQEKLRNLFYGIIKVKLLEIRFILNSIQKITSLILYMYLITVSYTHLTLPTKA